MGMSAAQARLLTITQRLNNNELSAQSITNAKTRLSMDTQEISDKYVQALDKEQLNYSYYDANGNKSTQRLTAALLTQYGELKNQYVIVNSYGQAMVSEDEAENFKNSANLEEFLKNCNADDDTEKSWYTNLWYRMNGENDNKSSAKEQNWTTISDADLNSTSWIQHALESGAITLEQAKVDAENEETGDKISWTTISYNSSADITETNDDTEIAKAEAEYNYEMQKIHAKDKEYDNELKLLDTEHSALESEYESVKTTLEKNVERSFKTFS